MAIEKKTLTSDTESPEKEKDRLNNKSVIVILSVLCSLLFAFYLGNRIIKTTAPDDMTIETITKDFSSNEYDTVININTADFNLLVSLPEIGEKRAEDILEYRKKHGGFSSVDELTEINGIGEETLKRIRELITVN